MAKRTFKAEEIVNLLRQIEVAVANGKTTEQASREAGIVEQTYYRWRKEYGGLQVDQAKRLKDLEQENANCAVGRFAIPVRYPLDNDETAFPLGQLRAPLPRQSQATDFGKRLLLPIAKVNNIRSFWSHQLGVLRASTGPLILSISRIIADKRTCGKRQSY